jgi:hypothetical protein
MCSIKRSVIAYALFATVGGILAALVLLRPVWLALDLHVPGEPNNKVDFTQPVDSVFYVRNAQIGYHWDANAPTSIWFHPLLVWCIELLPSDIPANCRLWFISVVAAFGAMVITYAYIKEISSARLRPWILLAVPLLPGGLAVATGNAEFPCLLFSSLLILSVVRKSSFCYPLLWGALAVLTKPNALYMVPAVGVYLVDGIIKRDRETVRNSLLGILGITATWLIWIAFVDINTGSFGAYWQSRKVATVPLSSGVFTFLKRAARVLLYASDNGEKLKFATALVIPVVDMWIILVAPLRDEVHRLSIIAGVLAVLSTSFVLNNPNKVVVYSITLPGHITAGLLFLEQSFRKKKAERALERGVRYLSGISYLLFCALIATFFVVGTPLEWYY